MMKSSIPLGDLLDINFGGNIIREDKELNNVIEHDWTFCNSDMGGKEMDDHTEVMV